MGAGALSGVVVLGPLCLVGNSAPGRHHVMLLARSPLCRHSGPGTQQVPGV